MKIHVKSLPARSVLTDIATAPTGGPTPKLLEDRISDDCTEYSLAFPPSMGVGSIRGITFTCGFSLYRYDCCFNSDISINFNISRVQPLKFIFCNSGQISHSFEEGSERLPIFPYQNIIVAGDGDHGHTLHFEAGKRVQLTTLEIDRPQFKRSNAYSDDSLNAPLLRVLNDAASDRRFYYQGNYSLDTAGDIKGMVDTEYLGFLKFLFLKGTMNILFALQIDQFMDDEQGSERPRLLRQRDLENVKSAIGIVKGEMGTNFTVAQLASQTGTNVNKLQEGFKYLYEMTVNRCMQGLKMGEAVNLLEHSEMNISEIVSAVELRNRSYFSKLFREEYGVSPRTLEKGGVMDQNRCKI